MASTAAQACAAHHTRVRRPVCRPCLVDARHTLVPSAAAQQLLTREQRRAKATVYEREHPVTHRPRIQPRWLHRVPAHAPGSPAPARLQLANDRCLFPPEAGHVMGGRCHTPCGSCISCAWLRGMAAHARAPKLQPRPRTASTRPHSTPASAISRYRQLTAHSSQTMCSPHEADLHPRP